MPSITSIEALENLYGTPPERALTKVQKQITPHYKTWIEASRFTVLSTVGPEGTDASPRGDNGPVVQLLDSTTVLLPDWRGNNRLDSLRNIIRDPRVSLMFMVPGCTNVVRINGTATLSADPDLTQRFDKNGKTPATVVVIKTKEIYYQCAKAILRSDIWNGVDESDKVPTAGDFVTETDDGFDGKTYDAGYVEYAKPIMW